MCGLITLFAAILQTPPSGALPSDPSEITDQLTMARFWTWIARLTGNAALMQNPVAPHVLAAGLEAAGDRAMDVYGRQMMKMVNLLGARAFDNSGVNPIGGPEGGEGKAGRIRLGILLEEWTKNGPLNPEGRNFDR